MKYTITVENANAIIANADSSHAEKVRAEFVRDTFGKDTEAVKVYADTHNKKAIAEVIATLWDGDNFKWDAFVEGVEYPFINAEAENDTEAVKVKALAVRDIFSKKAVKDSHKTVINKVVFAMATTFGHNLGHEFVIDKFGKEAVAELKMYTKFTDAPKVFFENATSNKGHERQMQVFFDTFFGEGKVICKKEYVDHLKHKFIKATADGYTDSNEFALLQLICNEAKACKNGKKYAFKSKLDCHKNTDKNGKSTK